MTSPQPLVFNANTTKKNLRLTDINLAKFANASQMVVLLVQSFAN